MKDAAAYPSVQFILLDYASSDGLETWVRRHFADELATGRLAYHRFEGAAYFHPARAKNMAHRFAQSDIVCNLDADNYIGAWFPFYLNQLFSQNRRTIAASPRGMPDCGGRIALAREEFERLGGYDEEYEGWGYEDDELIDRATAAGLAFASLPVCFLRAIGHSDEEREAHMGISKRASETANRARLERGLAGGSSRLSGEK